MKRYIRTSKYLDENSDEILFDDTILLEIDVEWPGSAVLSSDSADSQKFPGVEKFKEDVLHLLEDEYHFEVIEDVYDGKRQKGYISNREDSISIYFDTYFDLSEARPALERLGISYTDIAESGKVFCFIHLRFSDHELNDEGDVAHRQFINDNAKKYAVRRGNLVFYVPEESIAINERSLHQAYSNALEDLKDELDFRIAAWVRRLHKINSRKP